MLVCGGGGRKHVDLSESDVDLSESYVDLSESDVDLSESLYLFDPRRLYASGRQSQLR